MFSRINFENQTYLKIREGILYKEISEEFYELHKNFYKLE